MTSISHSPPGHDRRSYLAGFVALAVLTALEVGVVHLPDLRRPAVIAGLVGLALAKAALIGFFFMHLRRESRVLRWTALAPFALPALYALVLLADAAWRSLT
jgi:cytochrome c oxidase subunit 4